MSKYTTCALCKRRVKTSKTRRHRNERCPHVKQLIERGWMRHEVSADPGLPAYIKDAGVPAVIVVTDQGINPVYTVWIPGWAFEITKGLALTPELRHRLLKASAEDENMRDAIRAAIAADAWEVAVDLLEKP